MHLRGSWFNSGYNSEGTAAGVLPLFLGVVPNLAYDSWFTIGAENSNAIARKRNFIHLADH